MKRIAIKLVVFLLLGAVVNVAVAWGCALWSAADDWRGSIDRSRSDALWKEARTLRISQDLWTPRTTDASSRWTGPGITETWIGSDHLVRRENPPVLINLGNSLSRRVVRRDYGWPARCLHRTDTLSIWDLLNRRNASNASMAQQAWWRDQPRAVTWPGFLINTLVYAVVLWFLWSTPFATRRLIRKRRGRCVRCGYDLRGAEHDVCPECGAR